MGCSADIGADTLIKLLLERRLLVLLTVDYRPDRVPTDDLRAVCIEADSSDLLHPAASEILRFLLVARAESQPAILIHIHGRYGAQLAQNLLVFVRRLRTILAYFVLAVVIEALEGGLSVLVTLAGYFLPGLLLLLLGFAFLTSGLLGTLICGLVALTNQFFEKLFHLVSRVVVVRHALSEYSKLLINQL